MEASGIVATLSGGSAVSLYTGSRYQSEDLDFVTTALLQDLKAALEPLGFVHTGSPIEIDRWVLEEGIATSGLVVDFYRRLKRELPTG
jgi:hypothetical protein